MHDVCMLGTYMQTSRALCARRAGNVSFREAAALGGTTRCFEAVVHGPITGLELETDDSPRLRITRWKMSSFVAKQARWRRVRGA